MTEERADSQRKRPTQGDQVGYELRPSGCWSCCRPKALSCPTLHSGLFEPTQGCFCAPAGPAGGPALDVQVAHWALSEWARLSSACVIRVGVAVFSLHPAQFRTRRLQALSEGRSGPLGRWRWPPGVTRRWDFISHNSISYFPHSWSWTIDGFQSHIRC